MQALTTVLLLSGITLYGYPGGSRVPNGNSGEPGTGTPCAACHTVTLNPSGGGAALALPGEAVFQAGEKQRWTVTVTDADSSKAKAFQLTASAGTFTALSGTVVNNAAGGRQYVNQSSPAASFSFEWTPPASGDTVTVWLAGVAARGTRQTNVYTTSRTLRAAVAASPAPTLAASGAVVNAASLAAGISPGSWVTIFGQNLASAARSWQAGEIVNGVFPTSLDGVSVRINGKSAAISYLSPTQLNVQAPDDESRGPVTVQVTTAGGSATTTVDLRAEAPALFRFSPSSARYAAAVHADGVYAGPPGLFGDGVTLRAARPGDTVLLFGTGFGPTNPATPSLKVFSGAAPLANVSTLRVRIGGVAAEVRFAGLSGAGLCQLNLVVPDLADGDHLVEAEIAGVASGGQAFLAVRR